MSFEEQTMSKTNIRAYFRSFEPRSIRSSYCVIVWVRIVLKRTVVGDSRFDNLRGSHPQSRVNSVSQSMML